MITKTKIFLSITLIVSLLLLTTCKKDNNNPVGPVTNEKTSSLNEKTNLIDKDPDISNVYMDSSKLVLSYKNASSIPQIKPGDILVGGTNGGYLRKVELVSVQGNNVTVNTSNATITEALKKGSIDTSFSLTAPANYKINPLNINEAITGSDGRNYNCKITSKGSNNVLRKTNGDFEFPIENVYIEVSGTYPFEGKNITFSCKTKIQKIIFNISVDVDKLKIEVDNALRYFKLTYKIVESIELRNVTWTGEFGSELPTNPSKSLFPSLNKEIPILAEGIKFAVIPFTIGPLPSWLSLTLNPSFGLDLLGGITCNVPSWKKTETQIIGAEFNNGNWSPIIQTSTTTECDLNNLQAKGFGEAKLYLKIGLNAKVYDFIGPGIFAKGFLYCSLTYPPLTFEAGYGLAGGISFELGAFTELKLRYEFGITETKTPRKTLILGNSPPTQPSNPIPIDNATSQTTSTKLSWTPSSDPENDPVFYDIYLDKFNPPATKISSQWNTNYNITGLANGTKYYWQVYAKDLYNSITKGPVWSFTTESGNVTMGSPCPGVPTVTYAGKTYNTVQIGTQCWLKENLDVGVMIDSVKFQQDNNIVEKYCYYHKTEYCEIYGGLYEWGEVVQYKTDFGYVRGICPPNWHVPSKEEFEELATFVNRDGNSLKEIGQGAGNGSGTNTTGFSALLAGSLVPYDGVSRLLGYTTSFWTSSEYNDGLSYAVQFPYDLWYMYLPGYTNKDVAYSVRCIKD